MTALFLDSSYAIALASRSDRHHEIAVRLAARIQTDRTPLVTTRAVVFEIGNSLAKLRFRPAAVALLEGLEHDLAVEIVPLSEALVARSFETFRRHADKEWGLTDCLSFAVMHERGIADALSADRHFLQAGFNPLLLAGGKT